MHLGTLTSSELYFPSPLEIASRRMPVGQQAALILLGLTLFFACVRMLNVTAVLPFWWFYPLSVLNIWFFIFAAAADIRQPRFRLFFELLEFRHSNRKTFAGGNKERGLYANVLKSLGRNAIVGRESFFNKKRFWWFICEKPEALVDSLEWMTAGVLAYDFVQQADNVYAAEVTAEFWTRWDPTTDQK